MVLYLGSAVTANDYDALRDTLPSFCLVCTIYVIITMVINIIIAVKNSSK